MSLLTLSVSLAVVNVSRCCQCLLVLSVSLGIVSVVLAVVSVPLAVSLAILTLDTYNHIISALDEVRLILPSFYG